MHSASVAGALGRLKVAIREQVSVGLRSARVTHSNRESDTLKPPQRHAALMSGREPPFDAFLVRRATLASDLRQK